MKNDIAELASVLVVTQACFSLIAGLSALPFGIVEPGLRVLGVLTIGVAVGMFWLARSLRRGRPWARRWVIGLESISLLPTLILMLLPIGAIRGPVAVLVNLALPVSVILLLVSRRGRQAFSETDLATP
jgi:hypothetical protein